MMSLCYSNDCDILTISNSFFLFLAKQKAISVDLWLSIISAVIFVNYHIMISNCGSVWLCIEHHKTIHSACFLIMIIVFIFSRRRSTLPQDKYLRGNQSPMTPEGNTYFSEYTYYILYLNTMLLSLNSRIQYMYRYQHNMLSWSSSVLFLFLFYLTYLFFYLWRFVITFTI